MRAVLPEPTGPPIPLVGHAAERQAEGGAAPARFGQGSGLLGHGGQGRQQKGGEALGRLLAQRQGFHQYRQLIFQPGPQPGVQRRSRCDRPGAGGQRPAEGEGRGQFAEQAAAGVIQLRQTEQQLRQGIAGLATFQLEFRGLATGAMVLGQLAQARPVARRGGLAMGQQQRRFEARQIEFEIVAQPDFCLCRAADQAAVDGQFQSLGIAVAADRQLGTGQAQQREGRIHVRTPKWCSLGA